jgi:hypothetical protein
MFTEKCPEITMLVQLASSIKDFSALEYNAFLTIL